MKLEIFSTDFFKNTQISSFRKICPVGAEQIHANRQTDRHAKLRVTFHNFENKPKNNDKKQKLHKTREALT